MKSAEAKDTGKAPAKAGAHAHAVACNSADSSAWTPSALTSSSTSVCSSAITATGLPNITGNHPDPATSRSASLAICAFLSLASLVISLGANTCTASSALAFDT